MSNPEEPGNTPAYLAAQVYDDLRTIAEQYLNKERKHHSLQPTALINEAYVKIAHKRDWNSITHFRAVACNAMRQILVDHARKRIRQQRSPKLLLLTNDLSSTNCRDYEILELDEALEALSVIAERKARVVELRFFGGLTNNEAASILGISPKTAEADWYFARAWLHKQMSSEV